MRKVISVILLVVVILALCGCGRKEGDNFTKSGRFVIVSGDNPNAPYYETVIRDKDTDVLYLVIYGYNHCGITPILNADGTPMLWKDSGA